MRKSVVFMIIAMLSFICFAQEKTAEKNKEEKKEKTVLYDLMPEFAKDMTWKEKLKLSITFTYDDYDKIYELEMDAKVTEVSGKKLKKIKYEKITDKAKKYKKAAIKGSMSNDYTINEISITNFDSTFEKFYPAGNFFGYIPPKNKVKINDTWTSKKLAPIGFGGFSSDGLSVNNTNGKFKLISVNAKTKIAYISWEGKASIGGQDDSIIMDFGNITYYLSGPISISWKRSISFDVVNKRITKSSGSYKLISSITISLSQSYEYPKKAKPKKDDIPDEAKDDEDD